MKKRLAKTTPEWRAGPTSVFPYGESRPDSSLERRHDTTSPVGGAVGAAVMVGAGVGLGAGLGVSVGVVAGCWDGGAETVGATVVAGGPLGAALGAGVAVGATTSWHAAIRTRTETTLAQRVAFIAREYVPP